MLLNRSVGATPTIARVVLQQQRVTAAGCMRLLSTATHPPPRTVYLNGSYLPETEAKISVFDRGFQFSDSVYEVTRWVLLERLASTSLIGTVDGWYRLKFIDTQR